MHTEKHIRRALARGIDFIARKQQPEGNFLGDSFSDTGIRRGISSFFDTPLIAGLLLNAENFNKKSSVVISNSVSYIETQMHPNGSYNYWDINSPLRKQFPYPNDMDDTALAWFMLISKNKFSGSLFAQMVQVLTSAECALGGPYNTWLCDFKRDPKWRDEDVCVNANIAYALHQLAIELPNLTALFERTIAAGAYPSKYYPSPLAVAYFIARAYRGELSGKLMSDAKRCFGSLSDPTALQCALMAGIYAHTSQATPSDLIERIVASQRTDGSWRRAPLYIDPCPQHTLWHHGSSTLTTAFCVEALSHPLEGNGSKDHAQENMRSMNAPASRISQRAVTEASLAHGQFGTLVQTILAATFTESLLSEIVEYPRKLYQALDIENASISEETLDELGYLNLLGWIGYTVIDDILDQERELAFLPLALWSLRRVHSLAKSIAPEMHEVYDEIISTIERAYQNEAAAKLRRIPHDGSFDISTLPDPTAITTFEKSFGHALPALLLLGKLSLDRESGIFKATKKYFEEYLSARQLLDDMHDLLDDLGCGRMTAVTHSVVSIYKEKYPDQIAISIPDQKDELLSIFWNDSVMQISATVTAHLSECKTQARAMELQHPEFFLKGILTLETSVKNTLREQGSAREFIKIYRGNQPSSAGLPSIDQDTLRE